MFRNRRLCLGPFGEVHNSRDPLAPRRLSSLLAMETKTPRCPLSLPGTPANYDYLCGSSRGNIGSSHCSRLSNLLRAFAGVGAIPHRRVVSQDPTDRRAMFRPALGADY